MTNKEALEWLVSMRDRNDYERQEALDMAIKALEQPEPCEDAVSRHAVKELMQKYGFHAADMTVTEFVEDCLPSVTPKQKTGKWMECEVYDSDTVEDIEEWQSAKCSICGKYHTTPYMYYFDNFNFCPNCGAKMEDTNEAD